MVRLLAALAERRQAWRHGYDLMKETGILSGTLYPLLIRMTDEGLVEVEWREPAQPGRPPRHVYRLTASGVALAARARAETAASPSPSPSRSPGGVLA